MPLRRVTRPSTDTREAIACVAGRVELSRIEAALSRSARLTRCRSIGELTALCAAAGDALALVVVEPRDETGCPAAAFVRDMRRRRPRVALVAYCRADPDHSRDIIELAAAGIHELIFRDRTDWGHLLRRTLDSATQCCGAAQAADQLRGLIAADLFPLIEYCLYFPQLATSVPRVAAALGVHRKTLANYCLRAGLPGPAALIAWCRLIVVAHLLETQGTAVEHVAIELEFPSATALRNMLRRYTNYRPAELRECGMQRVLDAFADAVPRGASAHHPARRAG